MTPPNKSRNPAPLQAVVPPMTVQTVSQQVEQDLKCCEALLTLLEQEREALQSRDLEQLESIIDRKAEQLGALERSAQIRARWIQRYHQTLDHQTQSEPDADSAETVWQRSLNNLDPELKSRWETLKTLIKRCRDENEVNGRAVSRNQQTFGKLLNIMRGQVSQGVTYTAKGGQNGNMNSSSLGEA